MKKRIIGISALGTTLEYYDFTIYGIIVPLIAPLFFPSSDPRLTVLYSNMVFALGFLVRPLGAITFGLIGDRFGRRQALLVSVSMMVVSTATISVLPTYDQIGWWAPLILIICRIVQGFSAGGEYNGAVIYVIEHHDPSKSYFVGSLMNVAVLMGPVIGSLVGTLSMEYIPYACNWRVPFFIGVFFAMGVFIIRRQLIETPLFKAIPKKQSSLKLMGEVFRKYKLPLLYTIGLNGFTGLLFYTVSIYMITFLKTELGWQPVEALMLTTCTSLVACALIPLIGWWADRYRAHRLLMWGSLLVMATAIPCFTLVTQGSVGMIIGCYLYLAVCLALCDAPTNGQKAAMFPSHLRYTAVALGCSLGMALLGGTAPMMYTWLIQSTGNPIAPGYYLACMSIIGFLAAYGSRRKVDKNNFK